jgi:hypothetical protein
MNRHKVAGILPPQFRAIAERASDFRLGCQTAAEAETIRNTKSGASVQLFFSARALAATCITFTV